MNTFIYQTLIFVILFRLQIKIIIPERSCRRLRQWDPGKSVPGNT